MPLERKIYNKPGGQIAIWHLTESTEELLKMIELSADDRDTINRFRLNKRKKEWICSRLMLQQILNEYPHIAYTDNGKPFLKKSKKHISISHTNNYVAISIADSPTALDIEICSLRVEKAARRFVSDEEWKFITEKDKITFLTLLWSAKETLYKYFDEWGVVFKEHFSISPFELYNKGQLQSDCNYKHRNQHLLLQYEVTPNYVLVYHLK